MYLRFCETKNAPHTEILTLPRSVFDTLDAYGVSVAYGVATRAAVLYL
jgi:hypothetical protein